MKRGPKPRATAVNESLGAYANNPNRRPNNDIKGDIRDPQAPDFIREDKVAMKVWTETVDVLRSAQILSKTDTHLLAAYCSTYSEWSKCHRHIQQHGHEDANGKTSPQSVAYFKLSAQHLKLLSELGLSPSSRARLSVATSESDKEDEVSIASLLKSMKGE
jgi:P27 family predicted phage terminase small subunit